MSEALLQNYLIKQAKANGIYARKLVAVGQTGFPDVLIAINGYAVFIELKNPKMTVRSGILFFGKLR